MIVLVWAVKFPPFLIEGDVADPDGDHAFLGMLCRFCVFTAAHGKE